MKLGRITIARGTAECCALGDLGRLLGHVEQGKILECKVRRIFKRRQLGPPEKLVMLNLDRMLTSNASSTTIGGISHPLPSPCFNVSSMSSSVE
jgi:hypothetical protein